MRLQFILSEIWTGVRRNLSMTVSVTPVTIMTKLFIGFGLLAQRQVDTMKDYWDDRVEVSIFVGTDKSNQTKCTAGPVTAAQRQQISTQLDSMKPLVKGVFT